MSGLGAVVERRRPAAGAVHQLVADDELARLDVRLEAAGRARPHHAFHPELLEGPQVGPVRDLVRRELVLHPVAWDEGDRPALDRADGDGRRWLAPRRIDLDFADVVEERIEAGAAEHPDPDALSGRSRAQADRSLDESDCDELVPASFDPEPVPADPLELAFSLPPSAFFLSPPAFSLSPPCSE